MKNLRIVRVSYIIACTLMLVILPDSVVSGATQDEIKLQFQHTREELRLSKETEERIKRELMRLKKSGRATPEAIGYYETYLKRVQEMVRENQKALKEMEAAYGKYVPTPESAPQIPSILDVDIAEEELDEITKLDRQLNESLAEFDEMLLKELDVLALEIEQIRARTTRRMQELAEEAAQAARQSRQSGQMGQSGESGESGSLSSYGYGYGDEKNQTESEQGETGQSGGSNGQAGQQGQKGGQAGQQGQKGGQAGQQGQGSGQAGQQGQGSGQAGQQGQGSGQAGQQGQGSGQAGQQGQGSGQAGQQGQGSGKSGPNAQAGGGGTQGGMEGHGTEGGSGSGGKGGGMGKNIPQQQADNDDGQDDDIVARQLREAAENETDPELKEKLWKEYHDYKSGQ